KMLRREEMEALQAKSLAMAIAVEAYSLQHDDFDFGEFGTATRLELALANRFKHSAEITTVLSDIIKQTSSDALAQSILHFATDKNSNQIFENWEFVDNSALNTAFATRMKTKYYIGGRESFYGSSRSWREWQALIWWSRVSDEEREYVRNYLQYEFE